MAPARFMSRLRRRDDGASAVIVVIALTAILGGSMLSVDAGSVWQQRRKLITDTDAAALAAARFIDAGGTDACNAAVSGGSGSPAGSEANSIFVENGQDSQFEDFTVMPYQGSCDNEAGHVRVGGRINATLTFAPLFGIDDVKPYSSSTAQWGPIIALRGARPIGICDKSEHLREWRSYLEGTGPLGSPGEHPSYGSDHVVHRIRFQRGSSGCGTGAGNWDWVDYNSNAEPNGTSAMVEWLLNGFPDEVSVGGDDYPSDCDTSQPDGQQGCPPKTGALGGSVENALRWLRDNQKIVPIAVYDRVVDDRNPKGCAAPEPEWTGSGNNSRFCIVAFLLVRFWGWDKITGQVDDNSYFDMEFVDMWWQGRIGGKRNSGFPQVHGVQLCGTNYGTSIDHYCDV